MSVITIDPCPYLLKYSPDVPKKTKLFYILNTDKKYFIKENVESSLRIWVRIRFLEINGSPSLVHTKHKLIEIKKTASSIKFFQRQIKMLLPEEKIAQI